MAPLTEITERLVIKLFAPGDRDEVRRLLLDRCGTNLPLLERVDGYALERFRFAALKLSAGDLARLRDAVELANADWRDLLMEAGFGDDVKAHEGWARSLS